MRPFAYYIIILMLLFSCKSEDKTPQESQDDTNQPSLPEQQTPEASPTLDQKISGILLAYYEDLGAENIDVNTYFAPTVTQFFKSGDMPREKIAQSLTNGFSTVENRSIFVDANSLKVTEESDGYTADFKGVAKYIKTSDKSEVEQEFHNVIRFDKNFKITVYRSASDKPLMNGSQQRVEGVAGKKEDGDVQQIASEILAELRSGKFSKLPGYLDAETGAYLIGKPGAYNVPYPVSDLDGIFKHAPWLKEGWQELQTRISVEELPEFTCEGDDNFSKQGCFMADASSYDKLSNLMQALNDAELTQYSAGEIQEAKSFESLIETCVIETHGNMAMFFGKINGNWKLLILDIASYDCSA